MSSLKDIATALNLSVPLVSKVLSGRMGTTGCSEANRQAILAKAKELDYRPNMIAQALRTGRTGSIGVFIHPYGEIGSELSNGLLRGLSLQANAYNHRLWLSFYETDYDNRLWLNSYETDQDFLHRFAETTRGEIDGLLVSGTFHPRLIRLYEAIEKNGIPVVTIFKNKRLDHPSKINVDCDDFQVGYLPTRHLINNGCKRIAHINSDNVRYKGYLQALKENNIPKCPELVYTAIEHFDINTGKTAVQHWIKNGIEFDGLVAQSDHQAFGAICELISQGRRVPDDVKVFGVDDSSLCALSPIPISSVSQQVEEIGHQAINTIMKRIKNEPAESVVVQPVLRLRASTGD